MLVGRHSSRTIGNDHRYRLLRCLHEDFTGSLWTAEDAVSGVPVAIRIVTAPNMDPPAIERLRSSVSDLVHPIVVAGLLRPRLSHPNIARVIGFEAEGPASESILILEPVEGETLSDRLHREGPLDLVEAVRITADVAEAIAAAHLAGIVHGHLHPGNVLVSTDGHVTVTDFGVPVLDLPDSVDPPQPLSAYRAPEATDAHTDPDSDMYALGALLFALVTGHPPGPDWRKDPDLLEVPRRVVRMCAAMLAVDPTRRPRSPAGVASHLAAIAERNRVDRKTGSDPGASPGRPDVPPQPAGKAAPAETATETASEDDGVRLAPEGAAGHPLIWLPDGNEPVVRKPRPAPVGAKRAQEPSPDEPTDPFHGIGPTPQVARAAREVESSLRDLIAARDDETRAPPSPMPDEQSGAEPRWIISSARRVETGLAGGGRRLARHPVLVAAVVVAVAVLALVLISSLRASQRSSTGDGDARRPGIVSTPTQGSDSPTPPPGEVAVPEVVGLSASDAGARLFLTGLDLEAVLPVEGPPGIVVRSDPARGAFLRQGTGVTLFVGASPQRADTGG